MIAPHGATSFVPYSVGCFSGLPALEWLVLAVRLPQTRLASATQSPKATASIQLSIEFALGNPLLPHLSKLLLCLLLDLASPAL